MKDFLWRSLSGQKRRASARGEDEQLLLDEAMARGSKKAKEDTAAELSRKELDILFDSLREANDLASSYASLKLIKDGLPPAAVVVGEEKVVVEQEGEAKHDLSLCLTKEEQELLAQASLAVPYLMCKMTKEVCTRPRSMGGLAFSSAKADMFVTDLFLKMGPSCCFEKTLEEDLIEQSLQPADARKLLPKLKEVGLHARSKVDELSATVKVKAQAAPETRDV